MQDSQAGAISIHTVRLTTVACFFLLQPALACQLSCPWYKNPVTLFAKVAMIITSEASGAGAVWARAYSLFSEPGNRVQTQMAL